MRSTASASERKKGKGRDSDKNIKYQSDHKSGERGRKNDLLDEESTFQEEGEETEGRTPTRDSSQRSERISQT